MYNGEIVEVSNNRKEWTIARLKSIDKSLYQPIAIEGCPFGYKYVRRVTREERKFA